MCLLLYYPWRPWSSRVHQSKARLDDTYTCYVWHYCPYWFDSFILLFVLSTPNTKQPRRIEFIVIDIQCCITEIDSIPNFRSFLFQVRVRAIDLAWRYTLLYSSYTVPRIITLNNKQTFLFENYTYQSWFNLYTWH